MGKTKAAPPEQKADAVARFRDRIVELRRVPASELKRNPKNWRKHGEEQRAALEGILSEVGFAGAAVAYVLEDGSLELIDGHLRADVSEEESVPVLVTDLTPEEADKILASYDVLGLMAGIDGAALEELTAAMDFDSRDLEAEIAKLVEGHYLLGSDDPEDATSRARTAKNGEVIGEMELQPNEHYDYLVVVARNRPDWHRLCAILELEQTRKPRSKRIGLGRVFDAGKLLRLLESRKER